jgi:hypothetical protein
MPPKRSFFMLLILASTLLFTACAPAGGQTAAAPAQSTTVSQGVPLTGTNPPAATATTAGTTAATASLVTQAAPVLTSDEAIKAAQDAWAKLATAGPRHVSQTSYKGDTSVSTIEADSVPPNFHQVTSVMGTVVAEQYVYDGTIYNKVNGVWSQLAGAGKTFTDTLEGFAQGVKSSLVYADGLVVGIEIINGKPATAYSYTTTLTGLTAKPAQYTIWVDNASGLPVKRVNITPDGMKIVQLITYDATITLALPDEAKNSPPAQ